MNEELNEKLEELKRIEDDAWNNRQNAKEAYDELSIVWLDAYKARKAMEDQIAFDNAVAEAVAAREASK